MSGHLRKQVTNAVKDRLLKLSGLDIKAEYVTGRPSHQHAIDLFKGDWNIKFPSPFQDLEAGDDDLFEDERMVWLGAQLGEAIKGAKVLECGPLEGFQAYMLERLGAGSVLSIEANTRNYLRCLIVKEILDMHRTKFLLGDFVTYLKDCPRYDLVTLSGVLYHLPGPVEAIALTSKVTDQVYVWTHYYDEEKIRAKPVVAHHFKSTSNANYDGFTHQLYRQHYQTRLGNPGFMGGSEGYSHWLSREDLIGAFEHFGLKEITIHVDDPDGPRGPFISFLARRP